MDSIHESPIASFEQFSHVFSRRDVLFCYGEDQVLARHEQPKIGDFAFLNDAVLGAFV
jgi:hypothetical protein